MVDFNTETAINTPAKSIEGVLLLEKREAFLMAKEKYNILKYQNTKPDIAFLRARLLSLIDQWQGFLYRQKKEDVPFEKWIKDIEDDSIDYNDIMKIYYCISQLMDKSNLTRIDREVIDRTDIELENEYTGLD